MRISGITIPNEKKLEFGLTVLYGVGQATARSVLLATGIGSGKRPTDLSVEEENALRKAVESFEIEGNLKRKVSANIKRLKDIKAYRGVRHQRRLPVWGQRTKTNSRTVRGNVRHTMGSGRRKESKT